MGKDIEKVYRNLIETIKKYHPNENTKIIDKAYRFAKQAHEGQFRKSGDPFILHPLETALILAELRVDKETIIAALLHDVVEDTNYRFSDIESVFGNEVSNLVKGVTKLDTVYAKKEKQNKGSIENIKHLLISCAEDIRVILIKLADRLHNMRTLEFQSTRKQIRIAQETLDIYAPIASRMGIFCVQSELEDLCLKYLDNSNYEYIKDKMQQIALKRKDENEKRVNVIFNAVKSENIDCKVSVEYKHYFSIYKKMRNRYQSLDEMLDLEEIKVVVQTINECYEVMGCLHNMFTPIQGRIKDFIATPKPNLYRALHTTLIPKEGVPFTVHIMTKEMATIAKYGVLSYWKYKENEINENAILEKVKSTWLKDVLEWQRETSNEIFDQLIRNDFNIFNEKIYCYTPKGKSIELPNGSNVIDFAYCVHSDLGNSLVRGKINNKIVEPTEKLHNGDVVQIITSNEKQGPSFLWIKEVKTSKAKNKILKWYRKVESNKLLESENLFLDNCESKGITARRDINDVKTKICNYYKVPEWNLVLAAASMGEIKFKSCIAEIFRHDMKISRKIKLDIHQQIDSLIDFLNLCNKQGVYIDEISYKKQDDMNATIEITCADMASMEIIYHQFHTIKGITLK